MKLATFAEGGSPRLGAVDTARGMILDLAAAARLRGTEEAALRDMQALIAAGEPGLDVARSLEAAWPEAAARPLAGTRLLAPLPEPRQMRDCLVFERHLRGAMSGWERLTGKPAAPVSPTWFERPTWYKCNRLSVVGHEAEVIWPAYSELMDFELELACVIGRRGRDIAPQDAPAHIFGYTIFNDFTARDLQLVERPLGMGPMKSKDFDTGNVLGPWIVTADEIGDPQDLDMTVRVNGETWGGGNTTEMQHGFAEIVAFISRGETLHPGEVIASGTVGSGCGLELNRFLAPDDVVELEVERIGVLRNRIRRP